MNRYDFFKEVELLQDMRYEKDMLDRRIEDLGQQMDNKYNDLCLCMDIDTKNRKYDDLQEMLCEYCFNPYVEMPFCVTDEDGIEIDICDLSDLYDYIKDKTQS